MRVEILLKPGAVIGESPVWCDRRNCLWWVDVMAGALHALDPNRGTDRVWRFDQPLACVTLTDGAPLLLGLRDGIALFDPETGDRGQIQPLDGEPAGNRLNDAAMTQDGRWFVGTMAMQPDGEARGALYRSDPDGGVQRLLGGLHVSNGLAVSPGNDRLYLSDSWKTVSRIWRFDLAANGSLSNRALFFDMTGMQARPDGGCVDAEGCYWIAGIDGGCLLRLNPAGKVDRVIDLPLRKPTKATFGGTDLKTLFVTSIGPGDSADAAGAVLALRPGVAGLPAARRIL